VVEVIIDSPKRKEKYNNGPIRGQEFKELTFLRFDTSEDKEHGRSCLIDNEMHYLNRAEQKPCRKDIKEGAALENTKAERIDTNGCDEIQKALPHRK